MKITVKPPPPLGNMFVVLGTQRSNQQIKVSGKSELQAMISRGIVQFLSRWWFQIVFIFNPYLGK